MTRQSTSSIPRLLASGHSRLPPWRALLGQMLNAIVRRRERGHDRRLFATFNEHMLRDIGIDRAPTESEAMACFWRLR